MQFKRYLALGDSISIDDYPALDYEGRGLGAPRRELGAITLFFRNADDLWPEFQGDDLATRYAGIQLEDHSFDGATTEGVLGGLDDLLRSGEESLVTVTAGGNDLLSALSLGSEERETTLRGALANLGAIVDRLKELRTKSRVLVATVYDPSDGTGRLGEATLGSAELDLLARFNEGGRALCRSSGSTLVDLHAHFFGHGASVPERERWYWQPSPIEPGIEGASEVRRLWLEASSSEPQTTTARF